VDSPELRTNADGLRARLHLCVLLIGCAFAVAGCRTGLANRSAKTIRVMTWNIGRDSIFPGAENDRSAQFARVVRAMKPDVVCLQEVWRGSGRAAALLDTISPLPGGLVWQHHGVLDNVILSRSTLSRLGEGRLETREKRYRGHAMALSGEGTDLPLYLICAHFESRDGVVHRERQADLIVSQVYELQAPAGLTAGTPLVVLGDLNAVSSSSLQFLSILRHGSVARQKPGFGRGPDWDGSDLENVLARHNGRSENVWTWRNDGSEYPPARLDHIFYTGSAATLVRAFVLNTMDMTEQDLLAAGLEREDVMFRADQRFHDHLPVIADFRVNKRQRPLRIGGG
jgi:endonuclease/exonuclease/phosphatase family metal-dependent hydrolase